MKRILIGSVALCVAACGARHTTLGEENPEIESGSGADGGSHSDAGPNNCPATVGPLDPSFTLPFAWTAHGDASLKSGHALLDGGSITQTFAMPSSTSGCGPYAVKIKGSFGGCDYRTGYFCGLDLNGNFAVVPQVDAGTSLRVCLGDWAYGNDAGLATLAASSSDRPVSLTHLGYEQDSQCPLPGTVVDGALAGGDAGWQFQGGAFVSSGGLNGHNAIALPTNMNCDLTKAAGTFSVKTSANMPQAALQFSMRASIPVALMMGTDLDSTRGDDVALYGNGSAQSVSVCIPEWLKGRIESLGVGLYNSGNGGCPAGPTALVGGLTLATDPACPHHTWIQDGDFESSSGPVQWWKVRTIVGANAAVIENNPAKAHSGSYALHLTVNNVCTQATVTNTVSIPHAVGSSGPAVFFWYNTSNLGPSRAMFNGVPLPVSSGWAKGKSCLPAYLEGMSTGIPVEIDGPGGLCTNPSTGETWIDDVSVGNDPSCAP